MYVIFKKNSKQYQVKLGDVIDIDLVEAEQGSHLIFEDVLFVGGDTPLVGQPLVKGYQVKCEVLGESAGPKITSIKYQPNHTQVRKFGHRQHYTRVKVVEILKTK